ncbi:MAG: hypothetical protein QME81_14070 [bacterium]|nr:hypothetical protein [bacterium]
MGDLIIVSAIYEYHSGNLVAWCSDYQTTRLPDYQTTRLPITLPDC